MLAFSFGDGDQHRQSVFGDQGVGDLTVGHHRTCPGGPHPIRAYPVGRPLVGHEEIQRVVHHRGHRDRVDRFEGEDLHRSHVVQELAWTALRRLIYAHACSST
jgi:hypothetical protein